MAEPQDRDALFLEIARERGLLDEAGERLCRETQAKLAEAGYSRSMARIAAEKGLLTTEQVREIRGEMAGRGVLPRLGGYELMAKLGQGGMGTVYKARQLSLDRIVALKVLSHELAADKKYVERFRREGLIAARITHPNAVQIYDVGDDRGQQFIAMEYVAGVSADRLLQSGALDERRALAIVRGIAAALEVAHERGIVHRDIKPSNILLTTDGQPKLADLGIARQTAEGMGMTLTTTGVAVGTPQYMSPEQCRGEKEVDGRSDIYSLGATLFHFVCGRPPHEGASTAAVMHAHVYEPLPDPRRINPAVTAETGALIQRMMAKDRGERIQTCAAVIRDVDASGGAQAPVEGDLARLLADAARAEAAPATTPSQPVARERASRRRLPVQEQPSPSVVTPGAEMSLPEPVAAPMPAPARPFPWLAVVVGVVVLAAIGLIGTTTVLVTSRRTAAVEARRQRALSEQYAAKEAEAEGLLSQGKWVEAVAALAEARALGGQLETKPASYAGLSARLTKAVESLSNAQVEPAAVAPTPTPEPMPTPATTPTPTPVVTGTTVVATAAGWSFDAAEANRRQKEGERLVARPQGWTEQARPTTVATPTGDRQLEITYFNNTIGMEFVQIPAGEFVMGSAEDARPAHKVTLTKSFLLGATEVTQAQWQAVMGSNPSYRKGADNPVEYISWDNCQEFLKKLCAREGVPAGTYRLPTEAEWEHACRAGTTTRFYSGDADSALDAVAWYASNSGNTTHPVGGKKPNAFGLYDMSGNVWEWCQDWYGAYDANDAKDPQGPTTSQYRVLRGGCWGDIPQYCRSAVRGWTPPGFRFIRHGFRLVVVVSPRPSNP